jgi:hypothetical protein
MLYYQDEILKSAVKDIDHIIDEIDFFLIEDDLSTTSLNEFKKTLQDINASIQIILVDFSKEMPVQMTQTSFEEDPVASLINLNPDYRKAMTLLKQVGLLLSKVNMALNSSFQAKNSLELLNQALRLLNQIKDLI